MQQNNIYVFYTKGAFDNYDNHEETAITELMYKIADCFEDVMRHIYSYPDPYDKECDTTFIIHQETIDEFLRKYVDVDIEDELDPFTRTKNNIELYRYIESLSETIKKDFREFISKHIKGYMIKNLLTGEMREILPYWVLFEGFN